MITVVNPRARNKRQHREIVNIKAIGLKRPITVSRRDTADGPGLLLVAKGGWKPFRYRQPEIPAVVIKAARQCLVMSLVENIARRIPRPIDLMREVGALRSMRGMVKVMRLSGNEKSVSNLRAQHHRSRPF